MEKLTSLLGFEARYLVYPLIALMIAGIVRVVIRRFLKKWASQTATEVDDRVVQTMDNAVLPLLLLAVLYFVANLLPVDPEIIRWIQKGLVIVVIILTILSAAKTTLFLLEGMVIRRPALSGYINPLKNLTKGFFVLAGIALILRFLDVNLSDEGVRLVRIIGILIGGYVVLKIIRLAIARMEQLVEDEDEGLQSEAEKRAQTIGRIINSFAMVIVIGVGVMMILAEFGMDITPIITGAGIAGLAVGFGAQNLVRDIISGFFLILENQIRVGDVAMINGTGGLVEAINLRTTVLRDLEGVVHIFPNGEIKQVSNRTKEWSRYVIDVGVAYKEDVDYVMQVLREIGEELKQDETFGTLIIDPLEILGVDNFGSSEVTIKIMIKTLPLKQWVVGRELRRRIKNTFDEKGIEIPFPHMSVYFGEASKPIALDLKSAPERLIPDATGDGRSSREAQT